MSEYNMSEYNRSVEFVSIDRTIRLVDAEAAAYLEPPYVILTSAAMEPEEIITTAICWMLKKRPTIVPVKHLVLDARDLESLHKARDYPKSDQVLIFIGMAGLMTFAKEVQLSGNKANYDYLQKRWHAICTTSGIEDVISTLIKRDLYMGLMNILVSWQNWIKPRATLRKHFLDLALQEQPSGTPVLVKQALQQVKMVLHNFGMKTILLMDAFVYSQSKAILLPAIAEQAVALRRALEDLHDMHKEKFPYLKVYPLEGVERIHCKSYPDLYFATTTAINNKTLGPKVKYVIQYVQTRTPKHIIKKLLKKKIRTELSFDETVLLNLKYLGSELIPQTYGRNDDDDYDDLLSCSSSARRRYF